MNEAKPKSVKTVGILVIVASVFILFSNISGAILSLTGFNDDFSNESSVEFNLIEFLFENYLAMCSVMIVIGILYLIGGIWLAKYRMKGRNLVYYLSILLIFLIWFLMIGIAVSIPSEEIIAWVFRIGAIINAMIWSLPLYFLIKYLNKEKIKVHFN